MQTQKKRRKRDARKIVTDFLSDVVDDTEAEMKDRLKASELLSKTFGPTSSDTPTVLEVRINYADEA